MTIVVEKDRGGKGREQADGGGDGDGGKRRGYRRGSRRGTRKDVRINEGFPIERTYGEVKYWRI